MAIGDRFDEMVRYDGSLSCAGAIRRWIEGEPYRRPAISTRNFSPSEFATADGPKLIQPGQWLGRDRRGRIYVVDPDRELRGEENG